MRLPSKEREEAKGDWMRVVYAMYMSTGDRDYEDLYFRLRNTCAECESEGPHEIENYDLMWHDGDVVCQTCDTRVRMFDAG